MDEQQVAQCWSANASYWAEGVSKGYDLYREGVSLPAFLDRLGEIKDLELLDLGCGEGHNTRIFAEHGAKITGIDISEEMIACARAAEKKSPLGIAYEVESAATLTCCEDERFDGVVSTLAVMDMPEIEPVFEQVYRVLKKEGFFQFSILHPVMSCAGKGWIFDEAGEKEAALVSGYFETRADVQQWHFTATPVEERRAEPFYCPYFHRPLSYYANVLFRAGFVIEALDEPYADGKRAELADTRIAPYFLIIRCVKK